MANSIWRKASLRILISSALILSQGAFAQQKSQDARRASGEVYLTQGDEAPTMDPTKKVDTVSFFWIGHLYEGLTMYDPKGNPVPGTAEKMVVSPDGKTYTFTIRSNAKWHDGKPVSAKDFEFAFRRLVDPAYASEYAFIAETAQIKNAADIIRKKKKPSELGAVAKDDKTFVVELENPVTFFPQLMSFMSFMPIREDLVKKYGDKFATSVESIVGNGPFKLVSWKKENSKRMEKASTYWNAKAIKITAIEEPSIIKDQASLYNVFNTGNMDYADKLDVERVKLATKDKHAVKTHLDGSSWWLELNARKGKVFSNLKLRKALQVAINRAEYVNKIIGLPGNLPLFGIVPDNLPGSKPTVKYRKEAPIKWKDGDLALAQQYIKEYLAETKQQKVPSFTILSQDRTQAKKEAEYLQNYLRKVFNTDIKVDTVPFKTRLQKMSDADFDVVVAGWGPDYMDPMTFIDLFTSTNDNNHTGWSSPRYDEIVKKAQRSGDPVERVKLFAEAEKILQEEAPIAPIYQRALSYGLAKGLQNVKRYPVGADPDLRFASWSK